MTLDDFTGSKDSGSSSGGNKRRSEMFTKERFEEVLEETDYEWEQKDYDWTKEWVYETESPGGKFIMRIYSSVDKRSGKSRDKGSDAIRLVVLHSDTERPVMREKRTNRIKTWPKNLKKKIRNVKERAGEINHCNKCDGIMLIRKNKSSGDKFWGCSNYPDCKNTMPLD